MGEEKEDRVGVVTLFGCRQSPPISPTSCLGVGQSACSGVQRMRVTFRLSDRGTF